MKTRLCTTTFFVMAVLSTVAVAVAADVKDEAIKKDRQRIEGKWQVVELTVNGNPAKKEDAEKISVENGSDGSWTVYAEGKKVVSGDSTFDPTQSPKTIDFTPTEGEQNGFTYFGIYELGADTRKLCFAPTGKPRPTEFSSEPGSEVFLVTLERVKSE